MVQLRSAGPMGRTYCIHCNKPLSVCLTLSKAERSEKDGQQLG